jgi:ATP-dependent DNA helicase UvrD/PcrA
LENNEVITLSMAERSFSSSPNDLRLFLDSILHQASAHRFQEFAKLSALLTSRSTTSKSVFGAQRFFTHGQHSQGDRHVYASRSRFIPDRLLDLFERTVWPLAVAGAVSRSASQGPRIDVRARMRGMWR